MSFSEASLIAEPAQQQQLLPQRRKQVSFAPECKQHDGMGERTNMLDTLIKTFFFHKINVSERDVMDMTKTPVAAFHLYHDLLMLSIRLDELEHQAAEAWIPALPNGGGKGGKLTYAHRPLLQYLLNRAENASKRLYRKHHRPTSAVMGKTTRDGESKAAIQAPLLGSGRKRRVLAPINSTANTTSGTAPKVSIAA